MPTNPVLVVHGGAWAIPDDMVEAHLNGVRNARTAGWRVLERGGSALDAVEETVVVMEDDETFDAGCGSFLNRDGRVQLDAFIMDGATLRGGGVGCVERLRNPVRAARKILSDSPHVYFVAEGAERFAALGGPNQYFNPKAFVLPTAGFYGNLGRNTLIGPGFADMDFSLVRIFRVTERLNIDFRAELFNVLNHANFGLPSAAIFNTTGSYRGAAGVISNTLSSSRQIQFGLKLLF